MIGLAIHTSSPELGLARIDLNTGEMRSQVWPLGRDLTAYLHTCLMSFIAPDDWQSLAYLAVAKGPGGFTGTRIGVVVARTLAQQLNLPLFGVSSLRAIAQQIQAVDPAKMAAAAHTAISLRAQRGEVFGAIYRFGTPAVQVALPENLYAQAEWDSKLANWSESCQLIQAEGGLAHAVTGVLALAQAQWQAGDRPDWQTVLPYYGQHPVR